MKWRYKTSEIKFKSKKKVHEKQEQSLPEVSGQESCREQKKKQQEEHSEQKHEQQDHQEQLQEQPQVDNSSGFFQPFFLETVDPCSYSRLFRFRFRFRINDWAIWYVRNVRKARHWWQNQLPSTWNTCIKLLSRAPTSLHKRLKQAPLYYCCKT